MGKLVIFDLDGVLIESKNIHYDALATALTEVGFHISAEEQEAMNGLPTRIKLGLLTEHHGLSPALYEEITRIKQCETIAYYEKAIVRSPELITLMEDIAKLGIDIAVASNSIRQTLTVALTNLGIINKVGFFIGSNEVNRPKPHPEMYWNCMNFFNTDPAHTIIIEDSEVGFAGATRSGATLFKVASPSDLLNQRRTLIKTMS